MTEFMLNGMPVKVNAPPGRRLSEVLREDCDLTGTKVGCDAGDCGACTVLVEGRAICSCLTPLAQVEGCRVETVEGLAKAGLSRLQSSFLRHGAAQCGICTPGMLMAASALLSHSARPSAAEVEDALGGVLCRCTGYAKIIAAVCDAWREDEPASVAGVGMRVRRLDGCAKVDGTDLFGADLWRKGGLVIKAIRSPYHSAGFRFGDLAAWKASRPNVVAIFTAADIPGRNSFGVIPAFADQPALAENHIRFRGEAIALIACEDDGSELEISDFPVTWQPREALMQPREAMEGALIHQGRAGNLLTQGCVKRGNARKALASSVHVAEGQIETAFVEHAYIEPEAGAAWMEGETLVIRACTQAPFMDRDDTAAILGIPLERIRIIPSAVGGGFGSKLDVSLQPFLGLVTLKTGRPSRMVYSRAESMASTTKRHPATINLRVGCDARGHVTAMEFDGVFNTGAYASFGPTVANRVPVHATGPYRTPHVHARARAIHTNGPNAGAFRGFGVPQAAIAQETLFDRLADSAGLDRLEFRLRNAYRDGDVTATGQVLVAAGIWECLDALRTPWKKALFNAGTANAANSVFRHGVGVASCWYGCGNTSLPNPSTIRVGITKQGKVMLHQGATDIGQGSNTVITQICAQASGLPQDAFALVSADTFLTPDAGKTSASRQTYITGRAAFAAGQALRAAILRVGNMGEGAKLAIADGAITSDTGGRIQLAALPTDDFGYVFRAEESYDPPTTSLDAEGQGSPYAVYGFGAQMVELSVDIRFGTVRLHKITAAHDVGRAINPMLAEGQIEGGIAQGIGMALMEDFIPGRSENLHDYLIPTIGDVPPIKSILIEVPHPEGPFGAKGLGEHVLIPTAPAILNAIRHATGVCVTHLPVLPHRLLAAIKERG